MHNYTDHTFIVCIISVIWRVENRIDIWKQNIYHTNGNFSKQYVRKLCHFWTDGLSLTGQEMRKSSFSREQTREQIYLYYKSWTNVGHDVGAYIYLHYWRRQIYCTFKWWKNFAIWYFHYTMCTGCLWRWDLFHYLFYRYWKYFLQEIIWS